MSSKFPEGALHYLNNWEEHFFKKDRTVIERINGCTDSQFIDVLWQLESNIVKHNPINKYSHQPIYGDAYLGQWWVFLMLLIENATDFNSEDAALIRHAQKDFESKIFEIIGLAQDLAKQMRIADTNGEKWGFSSDSDVNPLSLLSSTVKYQSDSETTYRYNHWVSETVEEANQFDLKYLPTIPDIIEEIARQYTEKYIIFDSARVSKQKSKIYDFCDHFFPEIK